MAMATLDDWQSWKTVAESTTFMFDNENATDVSFKFPNSNEKIKAHRFMLMARSHVFFTMFHSELDKPGEDIEISDIHPAIFKQFLRFLYLDDTKLTTTTALQLTYCAEKYGVKALKAQCMRFLLEQVNETTWAEILDHAVFYNEETKACLQFLKSYKSLEVKGLQKYHISRETLEVILDYEELYVGEVDILKFCQTWAEQECKKKEVPVNMINKRKMLGPLVRKIPFCSMKQEEFVAEVSGRHFLNGQEELQILRYLCGADKANPPFPCMKLREVKDEPVSVRLPAVSDSGDSGMKLRWANVEQLAVKLPDVWDDDDDFYHFSIRCSKSVTLIGLTFAHPGDYNTWVGVLECMTVQPGCLTVYLQEPMHCEAGTQLEISNEGVFPFLPEGNGYFPFSSEVKSHDSGLYKQLNFVITRHHEIFNKPPFDTLIHIMN